MVEGARLEIVWAGDRLGGSNPLASAKTDKQEGLHSESILIYLFTLFRLCYNKTMNWELITNITLISSIITLAIFMVLGIYQWISRKSVKKVDKQLRWMPLPIALMAVVYLIFDKLWVINTRPNGSGEPSFPSTHVMIVATIFFITTLIIPKYIKNKTTRIILEVLMFICIALTCTGRVLANMHYPIDVIGAIIFAFIFSEIYYQIIRKKKAKK